VNPIEVKHGDTRGPLRRLGTTLKRWLQIGVPPVICLMAGLALYWSICLFSDTYAQSRATFVEGGVLPSISLPKSPKPSDLRHLLILLDLSTFSAIILCLYFGLLLVGYWRVAWHEWKAPLGRHSRLAGWALSTVDFPGPPVRYIFPRRFPTVCLLLGLLGTIVAFVLAAIAFENSMAPQEAGRSAQVGSADGPTTANPGRMQDVALEGRRNSASGRIFFLIVASLVSTGTGIVFGPFGVSAVEHFDGWLRSVTKEPADATQPISAMPDAAELACLRNAIQQNTDALSANQEAIALQAKARQQREDELKRQVEQYQAMLEATRQLHDGFRKALANFNTVLAGLPPWLEAHDRRMHDAAELLSGTDEQLQEIARRWSNELRSWRRPWRIVVTTLRAARKHLADIVGFIKRAQRSYGRRVDSLSRELRSELQGLHRELEQLARLVRAHDEKIDTQLNAFERLGRRATMPDGAVGNDLLADQNGHPHVRGRLARLWLWSKRLIERIWSS
jgi:hypothetical protein